MIEVDPTSGRISCGNESELRAVLGVTGHSARSRNGAATPATETTGGKKRKKKPNPKRQAAMLAINEEINALMAKHKCDKKTARKIRRETKTGVRTATGRLRSAK